MLAGRQHFVSAGNYPKRHSPGGGIPLRDGILRYRYNRTETDLRKTVEVIATVAVFAIMCVTPYAIPGVGAYMLIS